MPGQVSDKAALRAAFALHIANVEKAADSKATAMATAKFEQEKKLAAAEGATASALLKAENERLKAENTELKTQNTRLLDGQNKTVDSMAALAGKGFEAAGAQIGKATDMMNTAAQAGTTRTGR